MNMVRELRAQLEDRLHVDAFYQRSLLREIRFLILLVGAQLLLRIGQILAG